MKNRALGGVVGAVIIGGAWLSGACGGSTFVASPADGGASATAGGGSDAAGGRSGATSGASGAHSGKAGSSSGGKAGGLGDAGAASETGDAGSSAAGGSGGATPSGGTGGALGISGAGGKGGAGSGGMSGASGGGVSGAGGAVGCLSSGITWSGCQAGSCGACSSALTSYPLYFKNHVACVAMASCPNALTACGVTCPAPTDADKCDGTMGQWQGCRGTGCYVCAELVANYPNYFMNHPYCKKNGTCEGLYGTCNANCPAPVAADL